MSLPIEQSAPREEINSEAWCILENALKNNELFELISPICRKILRELNSFHHITSSACRGLAERYIPVRILTGIWITNEGRKNGRKNDHSHDHQALLRLQGQILEEVKCIITMCFLSIALLDAKNLQKLPQDSLQEAYRYEGCFRILQEEELKFLTNFRKFVVLSLIFMSPSKHKAFIMTIAAHFEGREQCARYCAGTGKTIHTMRREIIFESEAKRMYPEYGERRDVPGGRYSPQSANQGAICRYLEVRDHKPLTLLKLDLKPNQKADVKQIVADFIKSGNNSTWPRLCPTTDCHNNNIIFDTLTHIRMLYGDIWHITLNGNSLQSVLISETIEIIDLYEKVDGSYSEHLDLIKDSAKKSISGSCNEPTLATIKAAILSCRLYCFYLLHQNIQFHSFKVAENQSFWDKFNFWIVLAIELSDNMRTMQRSVTACGRLEGSNRSYSFGSDSDNETIIRKNKYYELVRKMMTTAPRTNNSVDKTRGGSFGKKRFRSEVSGGFLPIPDSKRSNSPFNSSESACDYDLISAFDENEIDFIVESLSESPQSPTRNEVVPFHEPHRPSQSLSTSDDDKENNRNTSNFDMFYNKYNLRGNTLMKDTLPFITNEVRFELMSNSNQGHSLNSNITLKD